MASAENHVQCCRRTGKARQPLRAAASRDDSNRDLRQAELRVRARNAVVARQRMFEAPAESVSVQGRHHRLLTRLDRRGTRASGNRADAAELANIRACDEVL